MWIPKIKHITTQLSSLNTHTHRYKKLCSFFPWLKVLYLTPLANFPKDWLKSGCWFLSKMTQCILSSVSVCLLFLLSHHTKHKHRNTMGLLCTSSSYVDERRCWGMYERQEIDQNTHNILSQWFLCFICIANSSRIEKNINRRMNESKGWQYLSQITINRR